MPRGVDCNIIIAFWPEHDFLPTFLPSSSPVSLRVWILLHEMMCSLSGKLRVTSYKSEDGVHFRQNHSSCENFFSQPEASCVQELCRGWFWFWLIPQDYHACRYRISRTRATHVSSDPPNPKTTGQILSPRQIFSKTQLPNCAFPCDKLHVFFSLIFAF